MTRKRDRDILRKAQQLSSTELSQIFESLNIPLGNDYQYEFVHARELSSKDQNEILNLFEKNMKNFYEQSNDGYDVTKKREELFDVQSRHLLIRSTNGLMAFAHFRFDMDYGSRVLYLYELQVDPSTQGKGLGFWCVERLKTLAKKCQMTKIVLTVYKTNRRAIEFYQNKCHFDLDSTDPNCSTVDYLILSTSTI